MPAFAFLAALIGAGFASGREIQQFFARFGPCGLLFALACAAQIAFLSRAMMIACQRFHAYSLPHLCSAVLPPAGARAGSILFWILLCVTASTMLCAGGELFALVFPVRTAYAIGFALTLAWGVLGAVRSLRFLGALGGLLMPLLTVLLLFLLFLKPHSLLSTHSTPPLWTGALISLSYAPLNLALCAGVLCEAARTLSPRRIRKTVIVFSLAAGALLLLGTTVLLRHQAQLRDATLPFVVLSARLGRAGFLSSAVALYLAVLSTLTALLRALYASFERQAKQRAGCVLSTLACTLCALFGFDPLISAAYPALGVLCAAMLLLILLYARLKSPNDSASTRCG